MDLATSNQGKADTVSSNRPVGDYLLTGVFVMLVVNLVQRFVGLARGLGFCHFLTEEQLGQWALVNSFFMLGVPLAVMGLPGGFSKFVEHYRSRNQLGDYLFRILCATSIGLTGMVAWMVLAPGSFSWIVFHHSASTSLIVWCVIALVSLVLFSVIYELVASLRQVRVMSIMQFLQSSIFAAVGVPLIAIYGDWILLLPSYAIACLAASLLGGVVIYRGYRAELVPTGTIDSKSMWRRIVPYAGSLWLMNLLSNTFEMSDRYMLLHLSSSDAMVGQAAVGQYHCGRILPNLLVSVALMLSGVLLPYLSADWEAGKRDRIASRMKQMLQSTCIGFVAISVGALAIAPILFEYGFHGRYDAAQAILPLALVHVIWVSLFLIAETFMLCAERGKELTLVLGVGLAVNLVLNWYLIQAYGLQGAVAATSMSGFVTLMLLYWRLAHNGCPLDASTVCLCVAPVIVAAGAVPAAVLLVAIVLVAGRTDWLLSVDDRLQIDEVVLPRLEKLGIRLTTVWP